MSLCAECHELNEANNVPNVSDMEQVAENARNGCIHCSLLVKLAKAVSQCFRREPLSIDWGSFVANKLEFCFWTDSDNFTNAFEMSIVFRGQ